MSYIFIAIYAWYAPINTPYMDVINIIYTLLEHMLIIFD